MDIIDRFVEWVSGLMEAEFVRNESRKDFKEKKQQQFSNLERRMSVVWRTYLSNCMIQVSAYNWIFMMFDVAVWRKRKRAKCK